MGHHAPHGWSSSSEGSFGLVGRAACSADRESQAIGPSFRFCLLLRLLRLRSRFLLFFCLLPLFFLDARPSPVSGSRASSHVRMARIAVRSITGQTRASCPGHGGLPPSTTRCRARPAVGAPDRPGRRQWTIGQSTLAMTVPAVLEVRLLPARPGGGSPPALPARPVRPPSGTGQRTTERKHDSGPAHAALQRRNNHSRITRVPS